MLEFIMKNMHLIFKLYIFTIVFLTSSLFAVSHSCEGTLATPVHGATGDESYTDSENSTGGNKYSGYYRFRPQVDGSIRIRVDQMHSNRQRIYIGTSCQDDDLYYTETSSGMDETFDLNANQWYYIRIHERNRNNRIRYRLRLDFTAVDTGCDNSLDTSANDNYPGVAIPALDHTNADASACISGASANDDHDYYHFTVDVDGTLDIATSSPNGHNNHFEVESSIHGTLYPYDTGQNRSLSYNLTAGERIVILFKETGDDTDWWQANFNFTAVIVPQVPPHVNPIPNQSATKDDSYTLDLSSYVTETNGDPIISYNLSGTLPAGLSFNSTTGVISGTPTETGTFPLSLTADDNDGTSNSESFSLEVTDAPVTCANYDSNNEFCPGATVQNMDQVSTDKHRCIYGESTDGASDSVDRYKFTVQAFGTLDITGSRTDGKTSSYHLEAGSSCGQDDYGNAYSANPVIPTITLIPGDTVYIYVKESGSDTDHYQIDFDFKVDHTFHAADDIYNTALNRPVTMDVLQNDNPGLHGPFQNLTIVTAPSSGTATVNGDTIVYTPNTGFTGTDTLTYTVEDAQGTVSNEATVTITVGTVIHRGSREFTLRNPAGTRNIKGNIQVIGNTVQCVTDKSSSYGRCSDNRNYHNNGHFTNYIDIDSDSSTFNSSSATLSLPTGSKVIWAGLYWQGYLHNSTSGADYQIDPAITISGEPHLGSSPNQLIIDEGDSWGTETIKFKKPGETDYTLIAAEHVDFDYLGYAAFLDITSMIDVDNPNGTYFFADIQGNRGKESNHGNYGGWTIVFIYTDPNEVSRNVSVFDGYWTVNSSSPINITVSGFRTPSEGDVNSSLSLFSMEGEFSSGGDYFEVNGQRIIDQENSDTDIFDGSISTSFTRNPAYANNDGLDLDVFDVSDKVGNGDTSATLKSATSGDRYTPSMFAFSTELYVPDICYDYSASLGTGRPYTSDSLHIDGPISSDKNLTTKILIKSMEGDLDLTNTTLIVKDLNASKWSFSSAKYSPNDTFTYLDAYIVNPSANYSEIAFGNFGADDVDNNETNGGTISPNQLMYAKFYHKYNDSEDVDERINIDLVTHMDFGSGPVEYHYSTDNSHLPLERCPTNFVYDPVPGIFNIERVDTGGLPADTPENIRYPLYTQVSGKDFDISVVSYEADDLVTPYEMENVGVELELINAGSFDNNASTGFDSVCQDYDQENIFANQFVAYPTDHNASRVDLLNTDDLDVNVALQNAAFRIWYITDYNNTLVIPAACYQPNLTTAQRDTCFSAVYTDIKNNGDDALDPENFCGTECGSGTGCYECLKINLAHPVCSRDNFAIRPETYRIRISDDNESNLGGTGTPLFISHNSNTQNNGRYAAGYQYKFDVNATLYGEDTYADRYYKRFTEQTEATPIPSGTEGILFEFQTTTGPSCADTSSRLKGFTFDGGRIEDQITHDNAGTYAMEIVDTNWTFVDQINSRFKPYPDVPDCATGSAGVDVSFAGRILAGCLVKSDYDPIHTDMELTFNPYAFDLSSVTFFVRPNTSNAYLYMNNLESATPDYRMAVKMEGNVTAEAKGGTALSNFTSNCAAENVVLWIDRTMVPAESTIVDTDGNRVLFQQGLQDINSMVILDTSGSYDMNSSLLKNNFTNTSDANGSAAVDLYFNFLKPYDRTVNPIDVNFTMLHTASPAAYSVAAMQSNYIPGGENNSTAVGNPYYYFAKVVPSEGTDGKQEYGATVTTTISVKSYCDTAVAPCSTLPGFASIVEEPVGTTGWYRMPNHLSSNGEGQVNGIAVTNGVSGVSISPNSNITFDTNGTTGIITITYPTTSTRPVHPVFTITPDEWLKYDNNDSTGLPDFVIHFLTQGLRWKGKGETGHVIETEPSTQSSGRLNW